MPAGRRSHVWTVTAVLGEVRELAAQLVVAEGVLEEAELDVQRLQGSFRCRAGC
jgi:hypothetical protein